MQEKTVKYITYSDFKSIKVFFKRDEEIVDFPVLSCSYPEFQ